MMLIADIVEGVIDGIVTGVAIAMFLSTISR